MKKVLLFLALIFLIISCGNSDESNNNPPFIGVKLTSIQYISGNIDTYSYIGNKLNMITNTVGTYRKFIYQGDYIVRVEFYSSSNQLTDVVDFTYNGGKLIKTKNYAIDGSYDRETNYSYNNDNTINVDDVLYNGTTLISDEHLKYFINSDGNLYKTETPTGGLVNTFQYDNKNTPHKNVTGYNLLGFEYNNRTQVMGGTYSVVNNYQYNSQDYPISVTQTTTPTSTQGTTIYNYE